MGGEPGGPGGKAPGFRPQRTRGVRPPVYKCTAYKGGPGACPRFVRLG